MFELKSNVYLNNYLNKKFKSSNYIINSKTIKRKNKLLTIFKINKIISQKLIKTPKIFYTFRYKFKIYKKIKNIIKQNLLISNKIHNLIIEPFKCFFKKHSINFLLKKKIIDYQFIYNNVTTRINFFFFNKNTNSFDLNLKLLIKSNNLNHNLFQNSYVYKKLNFMLFFSIERTNFSTDIGGFIFLNDSIFSNTFNDKSYNFKKLAYSFITKNEIHRYILKKYSKLVWTGSTDSSELNTLDKVDINTIKSQLFKNNCENEPIYFINNPSHLSSLVTGTLLSKK
jgi:hypothetical protein